MGKGEKEKRLRSIYDSLYFGMSSYTFYTEYYVSTEYIHRVARVEEGERETTSEQHTVTL